ncbi:hypothetical protein F5Y15DRAFT_423615 [Xylariaceae sp. FL0016]|nr:hypothetical protein F5Y15DRAFT_423615 [Xylariaceae sp. FL0016]
MVSRSLLLAVKHIVFLKSCVSRPSYVSQVIPPLPSHAEVRVPPSPLRRPWRLGHPQLCEPPHGSQCRVLRKRGQGTPERRLRDTDRKQNSPFASFSSLCSCLYVHGCLPTQDRQR